MSYMDGDTAFEYGVKSVHFKWTEKEVIRWHNENPNLVDEFETGVRLYKENPGRVLLGIAM